MFFSGNSVFLCPAIQALIALIVHFICDIAWQLLLPGNLPFLYLSQPWILKVFWQNAPVPVSHSVIASSQVLARYAMTVMALRV